MTVYPGSGDTSRDMARWQGRIDGIVEDHGRRLNGINGDIRDLAENASGIKVEVAALKTKVAIYGAIGGIAGSGIAAAIVRVLG